MTTPFRAEIPAVMPSAHDLGKEAAALLPLVRSVVACILGESRNHPDVEDCAQDVLRRAFEGQDRLRSGEPLRPWVIGIARHVAIDHRRSRGRDRQRHVREPALGSNGEARAAPIDLLVDPSPEPDELVVRGQRDRRIHDAISQLAEGQRKALLLFHVEGLGYQEVAERLGVPLGTVATWIARGRRSVAVALQQEAREA